MFTKTKVLIILLIVLGSSVFAQQVSHAVLVPAAGIAVSNAVSYSQSVGETAVEIVSCEGYALTQGFQQPSMEIAREQRPIGTGVEVYPNPATDFINVKLFGRDSRNFRIEVININGTIVSSASVNLNSNYYFIHRIAVDKVIRGLFYIRVVSMDGIINRSFKVEKM